MFDDGFHWKKGMCDWCYGEHFHNIAQAKAPDVFEENGGWKGGVRTKELGDTWGKALAETEVEMTTSVAVFYTADCDGGQLCRSCLQKVLEEK